jgi:hypothetical protein
VARDSRLASDATKAKESFTDTYRQVITLGKAVPADDDTSALFAQLGLLAQRAGVQFRAIDLDTSAANATPTPASTTPPASPTPASPTNSTDANKALKAAAGTTATGPATEATAAQLPIGAGIGAAGFPVMPYKLTFRGDFANVANFVHELDGMVKAHNGQVAVTGRLVTIDGFTIGGDQSKPFPTVSASFSVTTYLLPSGQTLAAGATPSGPAPAPAGAPASAPGTAAPVPAPASTPTPTATTGGTGQ